MSENKYVAVSFGPDESAGQRTFLHMMNGIGIIQIAKEMIDEDVKIFEREHIGAVNRIVLHNDKEVSLFQNCMKIFMPDKEYLITDSPDDRLFSEWLRKKDEKRLKNTANDEGGESNDISGDPR